MTGPDIPPRDDNDEDGNGDRDQDGAPLDNLQNNIPDPNDPDTLVNRQRRLLGQRGIEEYEEDVDLTNPVTGETYQEVTVLPYCKSGHPITELHNTYRCVSCDDLACEACKITLSHRIYCPECVEQHYSLTRSVYAALYLLEKDGITPNDLVNIQEINAGEITVTVDETLPILLDHNYLRTADAGENEVAIYNEDTVSPIGKEALYAGGQLYDDDEDIENMKERLRIQQVANNGR
jgi:hypothetical protein